MSAGTAIAYYLSMRSLAVLLCSGLLVLVGCAVDDDGSVTDDSNELNEGRGGLERPLEPPLDLPKSPLIGAKITDVYAKAKGTLAASAPKELKGDCTLTTIKDAATKNVIVERTVCKRSDVVRLFAADGTLTAEHADLNKDGAVDRYTGESGAVAQYMDNNFDGKIDVIVERVTKVKDFSMKGYDETFPKSSFLLRIREDRDRDGKLDHEKLTARGALPPG